MKFICLECVTRRLICSTCGEKVNHTHSKLLAFAIIFASVSMMILIMLIIKYDWKFTFKSTNSSIIIPIIIILNLAMGLLVFLYFIIIFKRKRYLHIEYLLKMPPGLIPKKKQISYKPKKGLVSKYQHLIGYWNPPILTKEEWMLRGKRISNRFFLTALITFGAGIILIFFSYLGFIPPFCDMLIILLLFLLVVLFLLVGIMLKYEIYGDKQRESLVRWKTIDFDTAIDVLSDFIDTRYEQIKRSKVNHHGWEYPWRKYEFPNNVFITSRYSDSHYSHRHGQIAIEYSSNTYKEAKELQEDLDEFLGKRDLIW